MNEIKKIKIRKSLYSEGVDLQSYHQCLSTKKLTLKLPIMCFSNKLDNVINFHFHYRATLRKHDNYMIENNFSNVAHLLRNAFFYHIDFFLPSMWIFR